MPDAFTPLPLDAGDARIARTALERLHAGQPAEAQQALMGVSPGAASHPEVLAVAALILEAQGRPAEARRALEGALQQVPHDPRFWLAYGGLLVRLNQPGEAVLAFRNGLARAPSHAELLRNLAHACTLSGNHDAAEAALRQLLAANPADIPARHNLVCALRGQDRAAEALAEADEMIAAGSTPIETRLLRAHLLSDAGRFDEAVAQYHAVIAQAPLLMDAHETLSRLLPQIGRAGEALDTYDAALAQHPESRPLAESAIVAARDLKDAERLLHWSEAAQARFGADPWLALAHAMGRELAGNRAGAIADMRAILAGDPAFAGAHNHVAPLLLAEGDLKEAEFHALKGSALAPLDQSGWAWLSVIWQMMNDPREAWLADYDRFVVPVMLEPPPGLARAEWLSGLGHALNTLHLASFHPAEQSLRGGTQTRGNLLDKRAPEIAALAGSIREAVASVLAGLPHQPDHPFLSRNSGRFSFAGSWSVRLKSEGFHINHIHQQGWLSSASYVALPPGIGGQRHAGCLQFGVPDSRLGLNLPPRRIVTPQEGMLVLFPSYMWHGTLPFESAAPRLTVAFDALPA